MKQPMQPLVKDRHGKIIFKENKIVRHLLDNGGIDLNQISVMDFSNDDYIQLMQLIGYSLSGYGELSSVSDESYETAEKWASCPEITAIEAENIVLKNMIREARKGVKEAACVLFDVHPEEFKLEKGEETPGQSAVGLVNKFLEEFKLDKEE